MIPCKFKIMIVNLYLTPATILCVDAILVIVEFNDVLFYHSIQCNNNHWPGLDMGKLEKILSTNY